MLGAENGRSGRRYIFCSLCFQPLPDGTFFPKTMLAFLFSPVDGDSQKSFCVPLFFSTKKAGQNPNDLVFALKNHSQRNSTNTAI